MADSSRFDFCPKCGALARDGICQSCGYAQQPYGNQPQGGYIQQPYGNQPQGGYMQQPYGNQPQGEYVQPSYGNNQNYIPAVPAAQPKKDNATFIVIIILVVVLVMTVAALFIGIRSILNDSKDGGTEAVVSGEEIDGKEEPENEDGNSENNTAEPEESLADEEGKEEKPGGEENAAGNDGAGELEGYYHEKTDVTVQNRQEEGQNASLPYYSGPYNALEDNLSYDVSFIEEVFFAGSETEYNKVFLSVEYPQISGDSPYKDFINETLYAEYEYYYDLFAEGFLPLMQSEEDAYYCEVNSYVTHMDEKILSVVFREEVAMSLENDPFTMLNFYCVNIDLESGTVLENTEILYLDEAFAIDFREREVAENGEGALTGYTDQEILKMLKDPAYLVAFYTPYGMEIGLNLDDRVVYVTYEDYGDFLNIY